MQMGPWYSQYATYLLAGLGMGQLNAHVCKSWASTGMDLGLSGMSRQLGAIACGRRFSNIGPRAASYRLLLQEGFINVVSRLEINP
jgi:hypothetical protein